MLRTYSLVAILAAFFYACLLPAASEAAEPGNPTLALPAPDISGGKPLMETLSLRKSTRSFSDEAIPDQHLSNLLWAAWGVNRENGNHTVPTSQNKQNVAVFAVLESGVWLYDPDNHALKFALEGDRRGLYGGAPLTLLFAGERGYYATGMHAGSMYQNVGLYCASAGLGNVVKRAGTEALAGELELPAGYEITIVQSIGWPRQ